MMTLCDKATYARHRETRESGNKRAYEILLSILLFGSVGAITWAIRGTGGWDGIDGTLVPGLSWGLLWCYLCWRKGIDARSVVLWLGLGIALGGELGYGQYVSWLRGIFRVGEETLPISPWIGVGWFMICGIGWGAPGGIFLGWALKGKVSPAQLALRVLFFVLLLLILIGGPFTDFLAAIFLRVCPGLLYPNYALGLYAGELDNHLTRTIFTNTQNFGVVIWWGAALILAVFQKDRFTLMAGLLIGLGFGVGFLIGGLWCLGYSYAPHYVDWWKMWELHAGFNLGLLYVPLMYWAIRQVDRNYDIHGNALTAASSPSPKPGSGKWAGNSFEALATLVFFVLTFASHFIGTALFLGLPYLLAILLATRQDKTPESIARPGEQRKRVALAFSIFFLLFILFHGGTSRAAGVMGFYGLELPNQYLWTWSRLALFALPCLILIIVLSKSLWTIFHTPQGRPFQSARATFYPERLTDLITFIAFIGAVSIFPESISVLYALFLMIALFALNRLNHRFDAQDRESPTS